MIRNILLFTLVLVNVRFGYSQIEMKLDTPSTATPEIFAKNIISTRLNERDLTISNDGSEIYYTGFSGNIFFIARQEDNTWSLPAIASFSRGQNDIEPAFSPDGSRLYFSRNTGSDNDIFYVERQDDGSWSSAVSVGAVINTSANEFYPSVVSDGSLYYTAAYSTGLGGEDIWFAKFGDGEFQTPIPVTGVSESTDEFNAYIDPTEELMYFGSFGREDGRGGGDIYLSRRSPNGSWRSGTNLGIVNTSSLDFSPSASPDGQFLFFTSQREPDQKQIESSRNIFDLDAVLNRLLEPRTTGSDIYWISR